MNELTYAQEQLNQRRRRNGKSSPQPVTAILDKIKPPTAAIPPVPIDAHSIQGQPVTLATLEITHQKLATAVTAAREWQRRRREQMLAGETVNASLVLLASGMRLENDSIDLDRTGYGCGKTHIAKACLWSECLMMDGEPLAPVGVFREASRLITNLDGDTQPSTELRAGIAVIDDVGTEGTIPFVSKESQVYEREARYFKAVNYAYEKGVSLIITGNLTVNELARHIGGRAWDRLQAMAPTGFIIDMTGVPSYRRRQGGR